jgi:DNA-binding NtrC family response regulator
MKAHKYRVLIVEDSEALAAVYSSYLEADTGYQVSVCVDGQSALASLQHNPPDLVLLDLHLPDMNGMDILRDIHQQQYPVQTVIITAHGSVDVAVSALHLGAFDFLVKPFDARRLRVTVRNALERLEMHQALTMYQETFARRHYEGFIGESLPMQAVYRTIDSAAISQATIFITGESGTGKEVCAAAIHKRSPRAKQAFVALNCGAIPRDLIESEIFGHVKGAFTGAVASRDGAARQADGGTLFLDEICEMPVDLQTKLLRFIQTGTFSKVGSGTQEQVNVRFVCATNRDPWQEVQKGNFREDLFYRLHVIPIQLPPLRERGGDVLLLLETFLQQYSREENRQFKGYSQAAKNCLVSYTWPGNVRQLQNVVRQMVVLNQGNEMTLEMVPTQVRTPLLSSGTQPLPTDAYPASRPAAPSYGVSMPATSERSGNTDEQPLIVPLWKVEKDAIERAIELCDGNVPKAAALLEVSPSTLYRKKERW